MKETEINKALEGETRKGKGDEEKKINLAGNLSFLRLKNVSRNVINFFLLMVRIQGLWQDGK